jgi:hypothetical protein
MAKVSVNNHYSTDILLAIGEAADADADAGPGRATEPTARPPTTATTSPAS